MNINSKKLTSLAVSTSVVAVWLIFCAEIMPSGIKLQNGFIYLGYILLLIVAMLTISSSSVYTATVEASISSPRDSTHTFMHFAVVCLFTGGLMQSWFTSNTAIANGDITPPLGTAWLDHAFTFLSWSVNDVGVGINNYSQLLPWSFVSLIVHIFGGSGAMAQRVWLTFLLMAIVGSAFYLAKSFRLSNLASSIVGLIYFFNPYTLSLVGNNTVFLCAMALIPFMTATIIFCSANQLKRSRLVIISSVCAPFVGYAYGNPPLVGILVIAMWATPIFVLARFGKEAAIRAILNLLIMLGVLLALSMYWIIPAIGSISSGGVNISSLSSTARWAFTEGRSTVANGFWLNTSWGWSDPQYNSFINDFSKFPLIYMIGFVATLPFLGFWFAAKTIREKSSLLRLMAFLTLGSLFFILLSNGHNYPGKYVFNIIYALPYGWLFQEPGRFLLLTLLGFVLMVGITFDVIYSSSKIEDAPNKFLSFSFFKRYAAHLYAALALIVALGISFPLWIAPFSNSSSKVISYPPSHVVIPNDWINTTDFLNSNESPSGQIMVLPKDDYYQMPYTWYYGNDGFINYALTRQVINPNPNGYSPQSLEIEKVINLESSSILAHNWKFAANILTSSNIPLVLVRNDLKVNYPGRTFTSPQKLTDAYLTDPLMRLIHRSGPLYVFGLKSFNTTDNSKFATTEDVTPNTNDLSVLSLGEVLVASSPIHGHKTIADLSQLTWEEKGSVKVALISVAADYKYSILSNNGSSVSNTLLSIGARSSSGRLRITISVPNIAVSEIQNAVLVGIPNKTDNSTHLYTSQMGYSKGDFFLPNTKHVKVAGGMEGWLSSMPIPVNALPTNKYLKDMDRLIIGIELFGILIISFFLLRAKRNKRS